MEVLFKSYHGIDVNEVSATRRDITEDFDMIIEIMLDNIVRNPSARRYKTESNRAVVANIIKEIIVLDRTLEDSEEEFNNYADEIAERLVREEAKTQKRMEHLNGVQKGSLVQAVIKISSRKFQYLIAKVEHSKFVEEIELILKGGFNPEENKIWKTCIFSCDQIEEDETDISEASVFMNNKAVYWIEHFLELQELRSDEKNTKDAWKSIEKTLQEELKKKFPSDYFTLRNAVITYFRRPRTIIYDDMINEIISEYEPIDADNEKVKEITNKLLSLPQTSGFDSNFISKPKEVKANIKSVHKINKDIDLIIREGINENIAAYKDIIYADINDNGKKVIVISATDDETYRMFKLK